MSPFRKFLLRVFQVFCSYNVCRNSLRHFDRNFFAICWSLLQRFRLQISSDRKHPWGGNITFDIMVSKLAGNKGMSLLMSLMVSVIIGFEFTVGSTSTRKVSNDSSSKLFPCFLIKAFRISLAVLICLSCTPLM